MTPAAASAKWKAYPAHKPSGVDWLGDIPAHWEVKRLKHVAKLNPDVLTEETDPDYVLSYVDITNVDSQGNVISPQDLPFGAAPSRARRKVRHGDTILSTVRTYLKAIAFMDEPTENLIVSTGFAVLRPGLEYHPRFLYRMVQSHEFVETVVAHSEGVGYPAINPGELAALAVWLPPFSEQEAIAAFLDRETAKIDALVAKKERLIELLREKRTALITHAVTKGLDPLAPMKNSGADWLDRFPACWTALPLKRWVSDKITDGPHETPELVDEGMEFISAEAVTDGRVDFERRRGYISQQAHTYYCKKCRPVRDDILVCKSGATTGKLAMVEVDFEFSIWSPLALVRADRERMLPRFLAMALESDYVQNQIRRTWSAGTQPNIGMGDLERLFVVTPSVAEQRRILDHVAAGTGHFEKLISVVQEGIRWLQEYRSAVISAAVTGKIDVREAVG